MFSSTYCINLKYLQPTANDRQDSSLLHLENKVLSFKLSYSTCYF